MNRQFGFLVFAVSIFLSTHIQLFAQPASVSPCLTEEKRVRDLTVTVRSHMRAVNNLGFNVKAENFDEWEKLTTTAREEFKKHFADAVKELAFASAERAIQKGGSLNPWNVNVTIKQLRSDGFMTAGIEKALRRIATIRGKPAMRARLLPELKALEMAIDAARFDMKAAPLEKRLEAIKMLLEWLPKGPQGALIVAANEYVVALAFAGHAKYVSKPAIDRLTHLTETDLKSLNRLTALLQKAVQELKSREDSLAKCKKEEEKRRKTIKHTVEPKKPADRNGLGTSSPSQPTNKVTLIDPDVFGNVYIDGRFICDVVPRDIFPPTCTVRLSPGTHTVNIVNARNADGKPIPDITYVISSANPLK